jgi:hypothetical protein
MTLFGKGSDIFCQQKQIGGTGTCLTISNDNRTVLLIELV